MTPIIEKINQAIKSGAKTIIVTPVDFTKWTVNKFNTYPDERTDRPYSVSLKGVKGDVDFVRTSDIPEGYIFTSKGALKRS